VSPLAFTAADLAFDMASHAYTLPDGRQVPSVTTVLKATGISVDFDEIAGISDRLATTLEMRRALGTVCHMDCHAYDDGELNWKTVDERVRPFVEAWAEFRENTRLMPLARERRVFHPSYFVCGTLDGIFAKKSRGPSKRILVDLKLGDPEDAAAKFQLAGYEMCWEFEHPDEPVDERWSVRLFPGRAVPYQITNYSAEPDALTHRARFQAHVTTYHDQAARRRRRTAA
jgi:hypothetical protein